jgi:(R,R)-butanediol dehydrogenase/meso-butanediol dehydrogenase/diacetyl reductase
MKAAVYKGPTHPLHVEELATPSAGPGELVFKVGACGICASDLHAAETGLCPEGVIFGHEFAGQVVGVGPGVTDWREGDRMIALPARPCGTCPACQAGKIIECTGLLLQGFDPRVPGAYAEYSTALAALSIRIPPELDYRDAAIVEPLSVGLGAWKSAAVPAGASVLVVGAGVIGLSVAKWARFFGAGDVGISERVPARIERAKQAGVDLVIDASQFENPVAEYEKRTGRAPSVIFECVGRPLLDKLIEMAPIGAQLVLVGTGMEPEHFTVLSAAMKRLRMTFTLAYEPTDFPFVLRMLAAGRIDVRGLVTGTVGLEALPEMFARMQKPNDHCKVLVTP